MEGEIKQRFEAAHPDLTVQFLDMGGGEILTRIRAEKERPGADVWWGGSAGDFNRAEAEGLLEPYAPDWTKNLPDDAKSPSGAWVATFRTPEVIMYNTKNVKPGELPATWDDLLDPKWKGRIVIRDVRASAGMKTVFGALIIREQSRAGSIDAGFDFLRKLDANTGFYAANPEVLFQTLSGDRYALTIWNQVDALLEKDKGRPFGYVIPEDTAVLVEPIALVKNAPNPSGAKLFHDFVNSPEQLLFMARENHRLPTRADLPQDQLPEWMKDMKLKPMKLDWAYLDKNVDKWIARWDAEIKGKH